MTEDAMTPHLIEYTNEVGAEAMALIDNRLRADGFVADDVSVPIVVLIGLNIACAMIGAANPHIRQYLAAVAIKRIRDEFLNS